MNEICIEAKLEKIPTVVDFVSMRLVDCPSKIRSQIGVAVDEIFSNIARYAYYPGTGNVVVRIAVDDVITFEFEDNGIAYNPLSQDAPDVSLSVEERETGGLGIFMVKNIMDSMEYQRVGDKNVLKIQKAVK